jgi:hypothetical protein
MEMKMIPKPPLARSDARKRDFVTRPLVIAFNDWRYGIQIGHADAVGHEMADRDGVPHAERLIDSQAERAASDQRYGFRVPKESADKARQDAIEEHVDAEREVQKLDAADVNLVEAEAALGRRHGPGPLIYMLILAALFCLTIPIDYGVAAWMPLPPIGQWMLTIFIGVVMVLCAHQAAKRVEDLQESHAEREEEPFAYRKDQAALGASLGVAAFVLVGTTIWRGQIFASDAQATGGPIHSGIATVALGALATLAFVVAVLAGMGYRRMTPVRAVRGERSQLDAERKRWQSVMDMAERQQRQGEVTLSYLDEREEHVVEAIRHWADERKARLRQRASHVARQELRKQGASGAAVRAVATALPTQASTGLARAAREVQKASNGHRR